ncbi:ras-related protein Rab-8A-like [Schistocerca cancellata]|uniref:ras-related protein Rab-8A-like n=1 Tax=Schistocerca cancellata TaxID=274614 RepID=UPI0021179A21|nr:ras-related protein Rab-8A-like [Schistocerca cancellata]
MALAAQHLCTAAVSVSQFAVAYGAPSQSLTLVACRDSVDVNRLDFKQKIINLDGTPIKLQIWDTAGQERFRTLTTAYYRGAMGILLMYDVTSMESFNHLSYWLRNIQENASPDVVKVLAGNKCDAVAERAVDAERGQKIAENFDMPFFEVSCKQNINIEEAFLTLARRIREQRERRASLFDSNEKSEGSKVDLSKSKLPAGAESWRCGC